LYNYIYFLSFFTVRDTMQLPFKEVSLLNLQLMIDYNKICTYVIGLPAAYVRISFKPLGF